MVNWRISRRSVITAGALAALLMVAAIVVLTRQDSGRTELSTADLPMSIPRTTTIDTTTSITGPPQTTSPPTTGAVVPGACPATDPSLILFSRRGPAGPPWNVWAVRADGSCLRQITKGQSPTLDWGASASPDGSMIAFVRKDAGVIVAHADGSGERLVLAESQSQQPSSARTQWSPDGRRLVVGRQQGVWTIDVASGVAFHLVDGEALYPSWSPDGKKVVFAEFVEGYSIHVINADGTSRHPIGARGNDPYWSTTDQIVYSNGSQLVVVDADGTHERPVPGSENLGLPVWSDDGAWIVASRGQGGMVVMRPDGSGRTDVPTGGGDDTAFGW